MLRRVDILFIILSLISITSNAQKISSVKVSGNSHFSESNILSWSGVSPGEKTFPGLIDSVKSRIAFNLGTRGYLHGKFEGTRLGKIDSSSFELFIRVEEGIPTIVDSVKVTGLAQSDSNVVIPFFDRLKDRVFNKFDLESGISDALTFFENNGYPFTRIKIGSINFSEDSLRNNYSAEIEINVNKEIYCRFDKIEIEGNEKTDDKVITRAIRLRKGEEYSQKIINDIPASLNRLGYFEPVSLPRFFLNSQNEGILLIKLKEKETNNFDGIIGYIPGTNPGESGYLTGLVNINLRNLFGTGRAAAVKWQQYDRHSQLLQLKYLEPWLFGYPFNLTGSLFQRQQDSSYVQRRIEINLEYLASDEISASVFGVTEATIPSIDNSFFTVYNSTSLSAGVNLKIDTRDDPYSPTKGVLFINAYSYGRKKITGPVQYLNPDIPTEINQRKISIDLDAFYELFTRQVVSLGLHGRELRSPYVDVGDLFRLGGTNTLRGYRENQFLGDRIFWSNLEYRLLLARRSFAFVFLDTGYYLRNAEPSLNVLKSEGFKIGYGVGFDVDTSLGVLGVSFGLAKGDGFTDGKIHFGLVNEF